MKYVPLAAVLLILLIAAVVFLVHAVLKRHVDIAADAARCASATLHGRACAPDMSRLTSDRALVLWKRSFNDDVDGLLKDYERTEDRAVEARRAITLKNLTIQAHRELAQDRRRR